MKIVVPDNLVNGKTTNRKRRRSRCHCAIGALSVAVMAIFLVAGSPLPALAGCPSQAQVKDKLERLTRSNVEVIAFPSAGHEREGTIRNRMKAWG